MHSNVGLVDAISRYNLVFSCKPHTISYFKHTVNKYCYTMQGNNAHSLK